jgi:hypothetical protein
MSDARHEVRAGFGVVSPPCRAKALNCQGKPLLRLDGCTPSL